MRGVIAMYSGGQLVSYKGYYVAVKDDSVVDKDADFFKLLNRLKSKYGDLTDVVIEYIPDEPVDQIATVAAPIGTHPLLSLIHI